MSSRIVALSTGADVRLHNEGAPLVTILANGGTAKAVAGTWSATSELLARELAPRHPGITFGEVRYRVKSWNALPSCMADTEAAVDLAGNEGAGRTLLVGFSMGGAVSIGIAGHAGVTGCSAWRRGSRPSSSSRGSRASGSTSSTARGTDGCPGSRE